ncbi:hypothetical protein IKG31_00830 [Candidatus Saccharibacteria bacterium]|nr:hypothetical protein [Candidatus Saccharibacteria bacterium]
MFFDSPTQIPDIAKKTNFSIFAIDPAEARKVLEKKYKSAALFLSPDEKTNKISIDMVRDFTALTGSRDTVDRFFVVLHAETLNQHAQNAFLKNLEEPKPHHHFVLVTPTPSALLPTILSRAQVFYLKESNSLTKPVAANDKIKDLAKRLITANTTELIDLANELSKKKDNPREYALEVVGTAIEILYKSYFATNQQKFLKKLPNLLTLYDNLSKNGHVKLHIVADML